MHKIFVLTENDFILSNIDGSKVSKGSVTWKTPSNIALVKYWGKKEPQLPENASISFTLDACFTLTTLEFTKLDTKLSQNFNFEIYFEDKKKDDFKPKIQKFFERIEQYVPFLKEYEFVIKSRNSFPHSSGIASSASGMSALALCIMSLEKLVTEPFGSAQDRLSRSDYKMTDDYFNKKASFLARLGSGSACRSIEGELIVWGINWKFKESRNLLEVNFLKNFNEILTKI